MTRRSFSAIACFVVACSSGGESAKRPVDTTPSADSTPAPATTPPASAMPAPSQQAPVAIVNFATRVGITQAARDTTLCLTIANDNLAAGTELLLVSAERPQRLTHARVGPRRSKACTEPGDEWGSVNMDNAAFYRVDVVDAVTGSDLTIAIVGPVGPFSILGDALTSDLDGDGRAELFDQCASHEGLHLSIITPGVTAGGDRWHQYFYVPYDLEPSCPGVAPYDSTGPLDATNEEG